MGLSYIDAFQLSLIICKIYSGYSFLTLSLPFFEFFQRKIHSFVLPNLGMTSEVHEENVLEIES
jgi:hypothetical protein